MITLSSEIESSAGQSMQSEFNPMNDRLLVGETSDSPADWPAMNTTMIIIEPGRLYEIESTNTREPSDLGMLLIASDVLSAAWLPKVAYFRLYSVRF